MENKVIDLLKSYALKNNNPVINFNRFIKFMSNYAEKHSSTELYLLAENIKTGFIPLITTIEESGKCSIIHENNVIKSIILNEFAVEIVANEYQKIKESASIPFPSEKELGIQIAPKNILPINVKTDLVNVLNRVSEISQEIIRITFPENIQSIIVTPKFISTTLLECCVYKISHYLQARMNVGYIYNRLVLILKGYETILNTVLNNILLKNNKVVSSLFEPDDFSFKFWAHFANLILQDFKGKKDKTNEEIGYCQSAYLIGFYIVYQKGIIQKQIQKESDLKDLGVQIKKPPYTFTMEDLYQLKDSKGLSFTKKYSRDFIHDFLNNNIKQDTEGKLPNIIQLKIKKDKEYYIQKDFIGPIFINKLYDASNDLRIHFIDNWTDQLQENNKSNSMDDDISFVLEVEEIVENRYPLLHSLINPSLLYIIKEEADISVNTKESLNKCFNKKNKLKPLNEILDIDRKELLKEAKSTLPFWFSIPIIKQLVFLFKKLFLTSTPKPKSKGILSSIKRELDAVNSVNNKQQAVNTKKKNEKEVNKTQMAIIDYQKAINKLKTHFIEDGTTINVKLEELAEKWNPLFDPTSKENLIEDVNSLIRDFLRSVKKSFKKQPPDKSRIRNLAKELVLIKVLSSIKKKEYLTQYIEVYMIKYLSKMN